MGYIPYYFDGDVQAGIVAACILFGLVAVVRGYSKSLPPSRLKRRAGIAAGCACAGILFYNVYILQRQSVEAAHHRTFGETQQSSANKEPRKLTLSPALIKPIDVQRAKFQKIYDATSNALTGADIDAVVNSRAEGYTRLNSDGTIYLHGKDAERQRLKLVYGCGIIIGDKVTVMSIQPVGKGEAIIIKDDRTQSHNEDLWGHVVLHEIGTCRDFWINDGGTWRLKRSLVLQKTTTTTVNDQPKPKWFRDHTNLSYDAGFVDRASNPNPITAKIHHKSLT